MHDTHEVSITHNETSRAHPNATACAPISTYLQDLGSLEYFGNKSEGNIQVRCIVIFVSRSSGVLLLICYLRLDYFTSCFTTLVMDNGLQCISTVQAMKCVFSPSKNLLSLFFSCALSLYPKSSSITESGNA